MDTVEVKLKDRARTLAGAFVGMLSPVLLAIVLKKTNLKGVHKYEFIRMLEAFFYFFEGTFLHLAALTLEVGMGPFLCVLISEGFASWLPHLNYISERFHAASKFLVLVSNILLMLLGCVVLFFIHNNAWFSWLVVWPCFIVAAVAMYFCWWWWRRYIQADNNVGGLQHPEEDYGLQHPEEDYHSKLEHSLEFSACIAGMMFLVLGSVVLEGLLRNTQLSQPGPAAPTPSEGPTTKAPGTLLAATLFVSFFTSAFAAFLLNVWTIPLVVVTGAWVWGFNIALAILAVVVVILITWEGLQLKALGTLLAPCILLLVLLKRCSCGYGNNEQQQQQQQQEEEKTKPAPLELTKVTFTGLLAVAVAVPPGVTTSASPGFWKNVFVFCAAATIPLGLLWRLLTHKNAPSPAVLRAVYHSSFLAQAFLFLAGIAFWVMAGSAANSFVHI